MKEILDLTKLSDKEKELRKTYLEGLRNLKKEEFEELKKEGEEKWQAYLKGSTNDLSSAKWTYSNKIGDVLMELIELEEEIELLGRYGEDEYI